MQIILDDFCKGLEKIGDGKLTALIPDIIDAIEGKTNTLVIGVDGSRDSAKSNFFGRVGSSMINSEFILSMQIAATATNLLDSGFASLIAEFTGGRVTPKHVVDTPASIDLVGFHESRGERIKDSQKSYDVTIIDETGNWQVKAAISALNTWAKHSKVIIIIANRIPSYINDWIESRNNHRRLRVDYWENPFCPKETFDAHEKFRRISPELWRSQVMYSDTDVEGQRIFSFDSVNYTLEMNNGKVPQGIKDIISIDVGGETGDQHCIIHLRKTKNGHIFFAIEKFYNASQPTLSKDVRYIRSETNSVTEVWDASGGGGFTLDFHCPRKDRYGHGIFEFRGNDPGDNNKKNTKYFNRRSEAFFLLAEVMADHLVHIVATNEDKHTIELLREEFMATVIAPLEEKENKIASKNLIKKNLNGRSPNIIDALAMGVWYLLTQDKKQAIMHKATPIQTTINAGYIG